MVGTEYRSLHHLWSDLAREIGAPPVDDDPDAPTPELPRWYCSECRGRRSTFEGLGTKEVGDKIEPVLEARPCGECKGYGLVCPICRGARLVRKRVGFEREIGIRPIAESSYLRACPGCTTEGKLDREKEAANIRAHYRETVLEHQTEMPF